MASDEAEEATKQLQKLRDDIFRLQSERARKQELVLRAHTKYVALKEEVAERADEVQKMGKSLEYEARHVENAVAAMESVEEKKIVARQDRLRKNVVALLSKRLGRRLHDDQEADDGEDKVTPEHTTEEKKPEQVHTTVWVTYVQPRALMNYHASLRICASTMLSDLFQDVCNYWGCIPADHYLIKDSDTGPPINIHLVTVDINADFLSKLDDLREILFAIESDQFADEGEDGEADEAKAVAFLTKEIAFYPKKEEDPEYVIRLYPGYMLLQRGAMADYDDFDVLCLSNTLIEGGSPPLYFRTETDGVKLSQYLPISQNAHLFLVPIHYADEFMFDIKKQHAAQRLHKKPEAEDAVETQKQQLRIATKAETYESILDVFKPWPGVFYLMTKDKLKDLQIVNIRARDLFFYAAMLVLTLINFVLYDLQGHYWLVDGVSSMLHVDQVRKRDDIWKWMKDELSPALFDESNSFAAYYEPEPQGYLQIRQQRAQKVLHPAREEVINSFKNTIPYAIDSASSTAAITIDDDSQWNHSLYGFNRYEMMNWRKGDPLVHKSVKTTLNLNGKVGRYTNDGFSVNYLLRPVNWKNLRQAFERDLKLLSQSWLDASSRMLVAEFNVYSPSFERTISCTFLFELLPSGAVVASSQIRPVSFQTDETAKLLLAQSLDYLRLGIIGYLLLIAAPLEILNRRKQRDRPPGWLYAISLPGFMDAVIIATHCLIFLARLRSLPRPASVPDFQTLRPHAYVFDSLFKLEALLFCGLCFRFASFLRLSRHVFEFWQVLSKTILEYLRFSCILLPVLAGFVLFAYAIWAPFHGEFHTFGEAFFHTCFFIRAQLPLHLLLATHHFWALFYMILFFAIFIFFFHNGYVAISCYVYWSQYLIHHKARTDNTALYTTQSLSSWTRHDWLRWLLWDFVYNAISGVKKKKSSDDDE